MSLKYCNIYIKQVRYDDALSTAIPLVHNSHKMEHWPARGKVKLSKRQAIWAGPREMSALETVTSVLEYDSGRSYK